MPKKPPNTASAQAFAATSAALAQRRRRVPSRAPNSPPVRMLRTNTHRRVRSFPCRQQTGQAYNFDSASFARAQKIREGNTTMTNANPQIFCKCAALLRLPAGQGQAGPPVRRGQSFATFSMLPLALHRREMEMPSQGFSPGVALLRSDDEKTAAQGGIRLGQR